MNKILAIVALLLVSTVCLTDKQILQQNLNGGFEENKLPDPTTIIPCLDDATAKLIVDFIGSSLAKAAKGGVSDLISLISEVKAFPDKIPQPVKDCLSGNKQFEALGLKYGIDNNTDTDALEKKIITYVGLHYLKVHNWMGTLNNEWIAGKYYQTGFDGATYAHDVLSISKFLRGAIAQLEKLFSLPTQTNKEILQLALNGLFEENKLPDPTTIVPCIDEATAGIIVKQIGVILDKAAKLSVTDFKSLVDEIKKFGDEIPQSVKDCLKDNAEFQALGRKYGITPQTDTSEIEKKVLAYVALHYFEVHKWLGDLDKLWKAGKWYQTGFDGAGYGHKILGLTPEEIRRLVAFV